MSSSLVALTPLSICLPAYLPVRSGPSLNPQHLAEVPLPLPTSPDTKKEG